MFGDHVLALVDDEGGVLVDAAVEAMAGDESEQGDDSFFVVPRVIEEQLVVVVAAAHLVEHRSFRPRQRDRVVPDEEQDGGDIRDRGGGAVPVRELHVVRSEDERTVFGHWCFSEKERWAGCPSFTTTSREERWAAE